MKSTGVEHALARAPATTGTLAMESAINCPVDAGTRKANPRKRWLKPDQVLAIVNEVRRGEYRDDIAARYGIDVSSISNIMTGKTWAHITGIRSRGERCPNERHAGVLLQHLAQHPENAATLRLSFDAKFGAGAAVKVVKRVMATGT